MFGWFGRDKDKSPAVPEIDRITIGRAVHLDPLVAKLLPEGSLVSLSSDTHEIVAQGVADMGEGVWLHRFYSDDDDVLLQVLGGDGLDDDTVHEITVFTIAEVFYPSNDDDWASWRDRLRATTFQRADSPRYDRVWFDNSDLPEDPVSFWETVHEDRDGGSSRRIFQTCMLYARSLGEADEFLLVSMEEPEEGDRCVSLMVGVPLSRNQISV